MKNYFCKLVLSVFVILASVLTPVKEANALIIASAFGAFDGSSFTATHNLKVNPWDVFVVILLDEKNDQTLESALKTRYPFIDDDSLIQNLSSELKSNAKEENNLALLRLPESKVRELMSLGDYSEEEIKQVVSELN